MGKQLMATDSTASNGFLERVTGASQEELTMLLKRYGVKYLQANRAMKPEEVLEVSQSPDGTIFLDVEPEADNSLPPGIPVQPGGA